MTTLSENELQASRREAWEDTIFELAVMAWSGLFSGCSLHDKHEYLVSWKKLIYQHAR